jgi:phosphoenolpyruvate carboxykinase (GTP)
VTGRETPVGTIPTRDELDLTGLDLTEADLDRILSIDISPWREEIQHRHGHLQQFANLPAAIWAAHHKVAAALNGPLG